MYSEAILYRELQSSNALMPFFPFSKVEVTKITNPQLKLMQLIMILEQEHEKQQVVLCKSTLKMMSHTTDMNTPTATYSHHDS
jgi:hypothetical protein